MSIAVYDKIKSSANLPSPSGVAVELMRLVDDESSTIDKITQVAESDPALASRLIKLVNCPLYGTTRTISSIATAVKLLGRSTVRTLALSISFICSNRSGASKSFDYERFWSTSIARAAAARSLAHHAGGCPPDEAFTVALLARIGDLALASVFPKAYDDMIDQAQPTDVDALAAAQTNTFHIDFVEMTAEMMADWRLPQVFCDSVRLQRSVEKRSDAPDSRSAQIARLLLLADAIAAVLVEKKVFSEDLSELAESAQQYDLSPDAFTKVFETAKVEWRHLGAVLSIKTHDAPSLQETHTRASRNQTSILVVDDDAQYIELLTKYLTDASYDVVTASNGEEALQLIHAQGCPLVITDWKMPKMNGIELCRAIRASEGVGFVYVIILTAHGNDDSLVEAFDAGVDDFLSKPCNQQELLSRLKAGVRSLTLEANLTQQRREAHRANAELVMLNEKLQKMATTDELTGLYNRHEAMSRLQEHWSTACRDNRPLSCMLLDIDYFKRCNDTFGHDFGDTVLRNTAHMIQRNARAGENVCRLGGEEFVVICPGATVDAAAIGAERIRAAVEKNSVRHGGNTHSVTVSVGVAQRTHDTQSPDDLLKAADDAMYEAKRAGRNCLRCAGGGGPTAPTAQPALKQDAAPSAAPGTEQSLHVLLVDDDQEFRRVAMRVLEQDSCEVTEASDGNVGYELARSMIPDVIVMDAVMPNMDGLQCTRKLCADPRTRHIPIVMVSGRTEDKLVVAALRAGVTEYLSKPVNTSQFALRLRAIAELARGARAGSDKVAAAGESQRPAPVAL